MGSVDHCGSAAMSSGFASFVLAGCGAALSRCVLVCGELASDDEWSEYVRPDELLTQMNEPQIGLCHIFLLTLTQ